MKKSPFIIIALFLLHAGSMAQKPIIYSFNDAVGDSLRVAISRCADFYQKKESELKLYALIVEEDNGFGIYLQEYSHLPETGYLQLIKSSNRLLQISNKRTIPVLVPAHRLSLQIKKDNISFIPYSGYYSQVVYENYVPKVVKTAFLM